MRKKTGLLLLVLVLGACLFSAFAMGEAGLNESKGETSQGSDQTYANHMGTGKRIAVELGDVYGDLARDLFRAGDVQEFISVADMLESVRLGRADAALLSGGYIKQLMDSDMESDFDCLWIPKDVFVNEAGPIFHTEALRDTYNAWFAGIVADGTWVDMVDRWIDKPLPEQADIPKFELTGENGTLKMCDTGNYPPLIYFGADGEPVGFDVEIMSRFAQHMGMKLELSMMAYEAIAPYVASGKADMSACTLSITDERKDALIFGEPSVITQAVLIVPKNNQSGPQFTDFAGKKIGVITGGICDEISIKIDAVPSHYSTEPAAIEAMRKGWADGFMDDLSLIRLVAAAEGNEDLTYVVVPAEIASGQIGAVSLDQDIIDRFNAFLRELKADGTLADMQGRWMNAVPDLDSPMPELQNTGENGTFKVATCATALPFVYVGNNGELKGYAAELALRFGAHEGKKIEFTDMDFGALIPYVNTGKADFAITNMWITEERKQQVLFTDSIYDDQFAILTRKTDAGAEAVAASVDSGAGRLHTELKGKKIGVTTGGVFDQIAEGPLAALPVYYTESSAAIEDVRNGRIDGYMTDLSTVRVIVGLPDNADFECIEIPGDIFEMPLGALSMDQDIIDRFNVFLSEIAADGVMADMQYRWLESVPDLDSPMPDMTLSGENGTLTIAVCGTTIPFVYVGADGEFKGYSTELVLRFAAREGMDINFVDMDFGGLIPYVASGKADLAISSVSITEERKKSVLFTDSIYDDRMGVVVLKMDEAGPAENNGAFMNWVKTGIERNLITDNRWKMILNGLGVTMLISLAAQVLGTLFGCFVCYVLMRKSKIARWFGGIYCGLIHGTPIVVLLMICYYIVFGNVDISSVVVAIAAFTLVEGAIIGQNLKGAIDTVDPVEIEAARSIGFPAFKAFLTVTLPQAVRRALPSYTNGFVELVKATAIVGYIAIQDLTRAGDIIRSRTYDAYFPLMFVALIYLLVTTICVQLFKFAIKRFGGAVR